jgi:hypothetical protein
MINFLMSLRRGGHSLQKPHFITKMPALRACILNFFRHLKILISRDLSFNISSRFSQPFKNYANLSCCIILAYSFSYVLLMRQ